MMRTRASPKRLPAIRNLFPLGEVDDHDPLPVHEGKSALVEPRVVAEKGPRHLQQPLRFDRPKAVAAHPADQLLVAGADWSTLGRVMDVGGRRGLTQEGPAAT